MKKLCLSILSLLLIPAILFTGCGDLSASNLTEGLFRGKAESKTPDEQFRAAQLNFAAELFKLCAEESQYENTLISPISVMTALAMTANGANGLTEEEMEAVLGGGMSTEDLNAYLYAYLENLSEEVSLANSIWFRENGFDVNEAFLQTNKDYYDAEIYKEAFNETTIKKVNAWVDAKTKGMIPEIIDEINADTVMMLINALAFEAEWSDPYENHQCKDAIFTDLDGKRQDITMMYSSESRYLEDQNTVGFIKYYEGGKYAFAALLPDSDIDLSQYVRSLTGEKLAKLLEGKNGYTVNAALPKFEHDYSISMVNALQTLGMASAFTSSANFSDIGADDLYIGDVLHKTYISVDESGTRAAAVTEVTVQCTSATLIDTSKIKNVILDRPFIYMIIDTETNLPVFIGTMTGIEK